MEFLQMNRELNWRKVMMAGASLLVLAGCEESQKFGTLKSQSGASTTTSGARSNDAPRDVEDPRAFSKTEVGLWDGRPSLGGIWVAHPDVTTPQRVIIRNTANSKSVIGALFRRERANPGPPIQVSSEAAGPLGMLAGAPVKLSVIALKREEIEPPPPEATAETLPEAAPVQEAVPIEPEVAEVKAPEPAPQPKPAKHPKPVVAPGEIEQTELDPVANAAAALEDVEGAPAVTAAAGPAVKPADKPADKPKLFTLQKPFIQVGTFSVEENANNAAIELRGIGMEPAIKTQGAEDKTLWRILVGPATSRAERREMLKSIKGAGFEDAFFVAK